MRKTKFVAINALAVALTALFVFVPTPGLPIKLAAFAIMTVVFASLVGGWRSALIGGLAIGIMYLVANYTMPQSPLAVVFQNPLVAIVPRVFIGFAALGTFKFTQWLLRNKPIKKTTDLIAGSLAGAVAVVTNTGLVSLMTAICYFGKTVENQFGTLEVSAALIFGFFAVNFAIEIVINTAVGGILVVAVKRALKMPFGYISKKDGEKNAVSD